MKKYSLDNALNELKEMPESVSFDVVAQMTAISAVSAISVFGIFKLTIKYLHFKIIVPMFLATSTAGIAFWYASQSFSPALPPTGSHTKLPVEIKSTPIEMKRDLPIIQPSVGDSVKKKKIILKEEIRTIQKGGKNGNSKEEITPTPQIAPLPPLPPITPSPAGNTKTTSTIKEERKIMVENETGDDSNGEDPFIEALLDYLVKDGLLSNREKFTLELDYKHLEVNDKEASKSQHERALKLFAEKEGQEFTKGSEIEISRKKGNWSISKKIED